MPGIKAWMRGEPAIPDSKRMLAYYETLQRATEEPTERCDGHRNQLMLSAAMLHNEIDAALDSTLPIPVELNADKRPSAIAKEYRRLGLLLCDVLGVSLKQLGISYRDPISEEHASRLDPGKVPG